MIETDFYQMIIRLSKWLTGNLAFYLAQIICVNPVFIVDFHKRNSMILLKFNRVYFDKLMIHKVKYRSVVVFLNSQMSVSCGRSLCKANITPRKTGKGYRSGVIMHACTNKFRVQKVVFCFRMKRTFCTYHPEFNW